MRKKKNAGFTLIELLVVVLIIGILASAALPQYQTAVDKSRFATVMAAVRALKDAQEMNYLSNGVYSLVMEDFASALPGGCHTHEKTAGCGTISLYLSGNDYVYGRSESGPDNTYLVWLDRSRAPGQTDCYAYSGSGQRGRRLCLALGGKRTASADNADCDGACTIYRLN